MDTTDYQLPCRHVTKTAEYCGQPSIGYFVRTADYWGTRDYYRLVRKEHLPPDIRATLTEPGGAVKCHDWRCEKHSTSGPDITLVRPRPTPPSLRQAFQTRSTP
jgi:hypothetical protein